MKHATTFLGPILLAAFVLIAPAHAHDLPRERTMLFEFSEGAVEAMVVYQEPPGRRVKLIRSQYDLDGDGELTGDEAEAAAETWVEYATQDLEVRIDGETAERTSAEVKFRNEHNGALSSAIYLTWSADELEPGGTRTLRVERDAGAPDFPTLVRGQVKAGFELVDAPQPVDEGATARPQPLSPGAGAEFRARRSRDDEPQSLPTRRP